MTTAVASPLPRTLAVRQPNLRVVFGIALSLAGVVLMLWLHQTSQPHTVAVLQAVHDVPAGSVLKADDIVLVSEPLSDGVAANLVAASERDALIGRTIGQPLNKGELVTRARVAPPLQRIPSGQRVMTIPVSPETAAGGQIQIGDDVEVLVTVDKSQTQQARTSTVLDRASVYAVGLRSSTSTSGFRVGDTSTSAGGQLAWIALVVDESQAQALARARWTGDLDVALLPPADRVQ